MTTPFDAAPGAGDVTRRLHPVSLLFSIGSAARRLLLPGIVVLFASRGSNVEIWLMLIFVPAAVGALIRYISFRYKLGADEMVVRQGIITRNERHIPYARIQNIDLVQNPFHRIFGVAEVRLQTASGDKPEAVIRVISLRAVERLRRHVFRGRHAAHAAVAEEGGTDVLAPGPGAVRPSPLLKLPTGELVRFGLISNRGMALVAAAMGALWQLDLWDWEEQVGGLTERLQETAVGLRAPGPLATFVAGLAVLLVLLVLLRLLSVAWAILKFHGFTLTRRGDDLRAEYGLITRVTATIPRHRIQTLSTRTQPLHRWCRRSAVQIETAGGGKGEEGSGADRLWLAPLVAEGRVAALIAEVLPDAGFDSVEWRPIEQRAWRRVVKKTLTMAAVVTAVIVTLAGPWGLLILGAAVPWAVAHARLYVKHCRYAVTRHAVLYRSGWWIRRMSIVRFNKIQAVTLGESPFDRRHAMATVRVDTAGAGRIGHGIDIRYLAAEVARGMADRLSVEAARTAFRW